MTLRYVNSWLTLTACQCMLNTDSLLKSHMRIAIISLYVSVCLSVCPHDKSKTTETTITKRATRTVPHESFHCLSINIRSKGQGFRVAKYKNILHVIESVVWVLHSIECPASNDHVNILTRRDLPSAVTVKSHSMSFCCSDRKAHNTSSPYSFDTSRERDDNVPVGIFNSVDAILHNNTTTTSAKLTLIPFEL